MFTLLGCIVYAFTLRAHYFTKAVQEEEKQNQEVQAKEPDLDGDHEQI